MTAMPRLVSIHPAFREIAALQRRGNVLFRAFADRVLRAQSVLRGGGLCRTVEVYEGCSVSSMAKSAEAEPPPVTIAVSTASA